MKRLIFIFLLAFCSVTGLQAQTTSWEQNVTGPNFGSSESKFAIDDNGSVYAIWSEYDGGLGGYYFKIAQYLNSNNSWQVIYLDVINNSTGNIELDERSGATYITLVDDEATKKFNVYEIASNGTISKLFTDNMPDYYASSAFDFKVGDVAGEYYWLIQDNSTGTPDLVTYNSGFTVFPITDLLGISIGKMQLQQVGDTLWIGVNEPETDLRLYKTHESSISFLPAEANASGFIVSSGSNFFGGDEVFLLSDRVSNLTVVSIDAVSGTREEKTFTNGVPAFSAMFTDFLQDNGYVNNSGSNIYLTTNFAATSDPNGYRATKVLVKDYNTDIWDTLGPVAEQVFIQNNTSVYKFSSAVNVNSNRFVAGYYNDSQYKISVLNTLPDVGTLTATLGPSICINSSSFESIFSELSLDDDNYDTLRIIGVTSSDQAIIADNSLNYSFLSKTGKKSYLDVQARYAYPGSTDLTISIYDGYDTVSVIRTVIVDDFTISANDVDICGDITASLSATASAGTLEWYDKDSESGGVLIATGDPFVTGVLTADTAFFVQAVNGACISDQIMVNVNHFTIPTVTTTSDGSRCGTGTVNISASASSGTIYWYTAATGGTFLGTGDNFTTPTITSTTTFYAEAFDGQCGSTRSAVVATVNPEPVFTAINHGSICGSGTVNLSAATSDGTIYWYDSLVGGTNLASGASYTTPVLSVSDTFFVQIVGATCTSARFEIYAEVTAGPSITGTTDAARCGTGKITLAATASSGTISWYSAATGGSFLGTGTSFLTPTISSTTIYYVETSNGSCTSGRTAVTATVNAVPTITSTTPASLCGSGSMTLSANASAGTIDWYDAASGGTLLTSASNNYTTPNISSTTTYYVEATDGTCTSSRSEITATINNEPTIATTTDGSRCGTGSVSIGATASAGTVYWFSASSGGTSLGTGTTFNSPAISTSGVYYAEANDGTCISTSRTAVNATIDVVPSITSTQPDFVCGTGSVTLGATASAGTIDWYDAITGGALLASSTNSYTTPSISGTTSYFVEVSDGTCTSARTEIIATVNTPPSVTGTTDGSGCGTSIVSLGATASSGTIYWFAAATGGTPLGIGTSFSTPYISGTTTYYVEADNGTCFSPSRTAVTATINTIPSIITTTPASICGTGTANLAATASTGTIDWYDAITGGSLLASSTNSYTTPSISGTTSYFVEVSDGTCTSARTEIIATVNTAPTITGTTAGSNCGTGTVTLGATASSGTISWFSASSGGTALGTGTSFTSPVISSTTTYYAETNDGSCVSSSRTAVIATINTIPSITSTTPATICGSGTANLSATASTGTIDWYDAITGGTLLASSTNSYTTASISSPTSYFVEVSDGTCTSARTEIIATVNTAPSITGTSPGSNCGTGTVNLGATASSGTISWYAASTGGTALGTGTSFTTPSISGTTTYYAEVNNGACASPSRTSVVATINTIPSITATSPASICGTGTVSLSATASTGTIDWYDAITGGTLLASSTNSYTTPSISSPTSYFIEVSDGTCTSNRTEIIATVITPPTITGTTNGSVCGSGTASLGASASSGVISWYAAASGGSPLGVGTSFSTPFISSDATYYVETNNGVCNSSPRTAVTATVNTLPTIDAGTDAAICAGDSYTLTASGGSSYSWDNGLGSGNSFSVSPAILTVYTVTGTDANGCQNTDQITVSVNSLPSVSAGTDQTICSGTSITLSGSGATSYVWDNSVSDGVSFTPGGTLTYTVTGTDGNGCQNTDAVLVTVNTTPTTPTISAGSATTFCSGGSVTLTSSSASNNSWSSGETTQSINVSASGSYTVTVTSSGCSASSAPTSVTVHTTPVIAQGTTANPSACAAADGSIEITGSGTGDLSWTGTASGSATGISLPFVVSSLAAGSYNFTFVNTNACSSNTVSASISDPGAPAVPTISASGATTFCSGGSITLTSSSASNNTWSTGATTQSITVSATGSYSVSVTVAGCTSSSAATAVTVNTTPAIAQGTTVNPSTCAGTDGSVQITGSGTGDLSWTGTASGSATSISLPFTVSSLAAGSYNFTFNDGCASNTVSATLNDPATPATPTISASGATAFCSGGSVTLTSSSASNNTWSTGATTQSIVVSAAGSYSVTVTTSGCSATSVNTNVTVLPNPVIAQGTTANPSACAAADGSIEITGSGSGDLSWTGTASGSATGISLPFVVSSLAAGSYNFTFVNTNACSSNTVSASINDPGAPAVPTISASGATTFCSGGSITLTSSSASNNTWSTGATTQSITVSATGSYSVSVTVAGCTSSSAATAVTVNTTPAIAQGTTVNPSTCAGTDGSVQITGSGTGDLSWTGTASGSATSISLPFTVSSLAAGSYNFTFNDGCTSNTVSATLNDPASATIAVGTTSNPSTCSGTDGSVQITGSGTGDLSWTGTASGSATSISLPFTVSSLAAGSYNFTFNDGCTSNTVSATLNDPATPATPTISASGATAFCSGGSVTLTSSSASNNTWSTGATTQSIVVSAAGSYSVTVTTSGCSATSANTNVTVLPNPVIAQGTTANPSACAAADGSIEITGSGTGDLSWTGTASGSATGISLPFVVSSLAAGSYNFTFVNTNACSSNTVSASISDPGAPAVPTISASGATTFCSGGSITLTSSSASNNTWSTGATTQSITVSATGSYSVSVTVAGCTSSSAATAVTVNTTPAIAQGTTVNPSTCAGTDGSVQITGSGTGDLSWTGTASGSATSISLPFTVSSLAAGSYNFTFNDGCASNTVSATLNDPATPATPTISASGATAFCSGGSVTLTSSSASNNTWSTGATTQSIVVSAAGSYSVTVATSGCSATSVNTNVTVLPNPVIAQGTTANPSACAAADGSIEITGSGSGDLSWTGTASGSATGISLPFVVSSLAAGSYNFTFVNTNACSSNTVSASISDPGAPAVPTISASGATTFCSGGSITLTSSSASNNTWSTGATTQSITVSATGSYSVSVTVAGCTSSSAATAVTVNTTPAIAQGTTVNPSACAAADGSVQITGSGTGDLSWTGTASGSATSISLPFTVSSLAAGSYNFTFNDGCASNTVSATLNDPATPATPTISASGATAFCSGGSVTLTSSSASNNTWSTGATTQSIVVSAAGSYSVTVATSGCSATSVNTNVTVLPNPVIAQGTTANPSACAAADGSIEITGSGTGDLSWTGTASGSATGISLPFVVSSLAAGSYNFTFVNTNACSSNTVSASISDPGAPAVPTISASGATTFCSGGSITLTSSSASNNTWSTGATTQSITVSATGSYSVSVTVAGCTSSSAATAVTVNTTPAIAQGTTVNPSTCAGTDGSVQITGSGTGDLSWTGTASGSATSISLPFTVSSLAAGSYNFTFNDGCASNTVSATLNDPASATIAVGTTSNPSTCAGTDGSVQITGSGTGDLSWTGTASGSATSISLPFTVSSLAAGSYNFTFNDGCTSNTVSATLNDPATPATPTISASGATAFCSGGSVTLTSSSASNNTWSTGATTQSIVVSAAGSYSVTVTTSGCSATSANTNVTVLPNPVIAQGTTANPSACAAADGSIEITGSGSGDLSWTGTASGSATGISLPFVVSSLAAGSYNFTFVNTNACSSNTVSASISDPGAPAVPTISASGATTFCSGGSITLTSSSASNNTWSTGATTQSITVSATGSYSVSVTVAGCTSSSAATAVTVNTTPAIAQGTTVNPSTCAGTDGSVQITGSGTGDLSWTGTASGSATSISLPFTVSSLAAGSYNFTFNDGCASNTVSATLNDPASATIAVGTTSNPSTCAGTDGSVQITGSGTGDLSWTGTASGSATSISLPFTVSSLAAGSYNFTFNDGCTSNTVSATLNDPASSTISVGTTTDPSVCGASDGSIEVLGSTSGDLSWTGTASGTASAITLPFVVSSLAAGTYNFSFNDGCISNTLSVSINDPGAPATPLISAGSATTFCAGNNVTLTSSSASNNLWSTGETTQSIVVNTTGLYSVSVTVAGCTSSSVAENVTVNSLPVVDAGIDQTVCAGTSVLLSGSGAAGYSWDNGISDAIAFVPASTANYTVTGTDANGCSNTDVVTVNVNALPVVDGGLDLTICAGSSITLTASGASSYSWDNGITDGVSFIPLTSQIYTVTGTDANGCINTDQVNINVNSLPIVDAGADQNICAGTSIVLSGSGASSYSWDNGVADAVSFIPLATQSYTVTGTDGNGCQNSDQVTVSVNNLPAVNAGFDVSVCSGAAITLSGIGASSYTWDNGVADAVSFNPTTTTTYTVTGTDANGCINTDQVLVTVLASPTVSSASSVEVCEFEKIILSASSTASIILWYDQPTGGTDIAQGFTFETPNLSSSVTYFVEAFENGCTSARIPVNVSINGKPQIAMTSTNSDCGNSNGTASASISSGTAPYTYYWSSGEQQVFSVSGLTTGSYYFNVEDAKGCKAIGVTEVIPNSISTNPVVSNPTCAGDANGSIDLNIAGLSGSLTFLWNTGHNTASISNLKAGTYEVSIKNDVGCLVTASFILTEPAAISHSLATVQPSCGINDGQIAITSTTGGTAPYQFNWSNGNFGSLNDNLTYGIYVLTTVDNNGCSSDETVLLSEKNAPTVEGTVVPTACGATTGAINLDVTPAAGDAISAITWSNGATTEDISGLNTGNYVSILTTALGCTAVNVWKVAIAQPATQEICLVSVDSVTTTNLVVWEKVETTGISHYNIYRESNQIDDYQLIDTVNFESLSVFNDVIASPMVRSWRYKISAVNTCGVEGPLSANHKTLHLNTFDLGASGVKVTWDKYEGTSFSSYVLWRYSDVNGWENIATLPTSVLNFTDATLFSEPGLDYMVEIVLDQTCTATVWRAQDFNTSRSNKEKGIFNPGSGTGVFSNNGLLEFENGNISLLVYPNPFENTVMLNLQGADKLNIGIYDLQGKLIRSQLCHNGETSVDMSNLSDGVYFVRATINNQEQTIKLVKQ